MDGYPQRDTIFEFVYFISLMKSVGCFLFSPLFIWVLLVSAASWFGCVVILSLYFCAYLLISFLTLGIFRFLRISLFLTYHGVLTIILSMFDCNDSRYMESIQDFIQQSLPLPHPPVASLQLDICIDRAHENTLRCRWKDFRLGRDFLNL